MDAGLSNTLRVLTLIAIGGGLPAWAIFGNFPGPSHPSAPATAAKPDQAARPAMAEGPPRAKVIGVEPLATPPAPGPIARSSIAPTTAAPPTAAPMSPPSGDRLNLVQDRLKQLGAYYLLLESMPGHSPNYRFHAAFGSGPSDSTGRRFEVTDSQPMRAMERVLAEVEQWSAQRISNRGRDIDRR